MKTPLYYDYQAGWKNLFQYSPSIIMILTLVLGFLCAGIFSGEFQLKANASFLFFLIMAEIRLYGQK